MEMKNKKPGLKLLFSLTAFSKTPYPYSNLFWCLVDLVAQCKKILITKDLTFNWYEINLTIMSVSLTFDD